MLVVMHGRRNRGGRLRSRRSEQQWRWHRCVFPFQLCHFSLPPPPLLRSDRVCIKLLVYVQLYWKKNDEYTFLPPICRKTCTRKGKHVSPLFSPVFAAAADVAAAAAAAAVLVPVPGGGGAAATAAATATAAAATATAAARV